MARSAKLVTGRLSVHRDGFGFLIPDRRDEGFPDDVFLPPDAAAKAMHGDRVAVRITRLGRDGRAEGDIAQVLERAHATIVGKFRLRRRGMFVEPFDPRVQHWIEIPEGMAIPKESASTDRIGTSTMTVESPADLEGMIVDVEIIDFPDRSGDAVGRVIEILGDEDDFGVDVEIVIRKHHIPNRFPLDVIGHAQRIPATIAQAEIARRRDFRDLPIVTIDGETARDFDDAVWVDRLPGGNFALHVHIADVSHYVLPGTPIDREAQMRGTSVYFPDRAVPMLPLELSTEICSLKPDVDRLVMSALLEIDHKGDVVAQEFARGVIRSVERMTYTAVHGVLEGDATLSERYAGLVERFEIMRELALILNKKRKRRGSIDFDLPEAQIEFDQSGEMTGIARSERNIAHRIIEEFMLAANEAVAEHITNAESPMVYRIHEEPDPKKVAEFEEIALQFGVTLVGGALPVKRFPMVTKHRDGRKTRHDLVHVDDRLKVNSKQYQKLVAKIEGKPEERILSYLMLRSLKQARYSADNRGHFALASDCYTHFTSPIRRYPDLLVHRALGALFDGAAPPYGEQHLSRLAEMNSVSERVAADAERELVEWKKVKFMADRVGDEFRALIISVTKYGFFVELEELFVEGMVPIDTLPGDRYRYHENVRRIVGERTKRQFAIGERLQVRLDRIDGVERKLQFSVVVPAGSGKKRKRRE